MTTDTAPAPAPATFNVRTGAGTTHRLTAGRTYTHRGYLTTNRADSVIGKSDCGSTTSSAATLTTDPVDCPKCLAR